MTAFFKLILSVSIIGLGTTAFGAGTAAAGEQEDAVLAKVIEGYGGQKFETMKSLTLKSDLRFEWIGQGQDTGYLDLPPMRKIHEIDFKNGWGSEESWAIGGDITERVLTTDAGQYTINYITKTYGLDGDADYYAHFGSEIRASDTLLARELLKQKDSAKHLGQKMYRGAIHDIIQFDMPGTSIAPELWVNSETGHISKMERPIPDVYNIYYVFGNFQTSGGVTYADDFALYVDDTLIEYAKWRSLSVNRVRRNIFNLDKGMRQEPARVDGSEMSAENMGGNIYHTGQNGAYTVFYDTGDSVTAVGAYGGLTERFDAYKGAAGIDKPLGTVVATHFHQDHVDGAVDALALGAKLLAPETARANIRRSAEQDLSDSQFSPITSDTQLPGAEIKLIDTVHSPDYALVYFPGAKTVFQADHYNSVYMEGGSPVWRHATELRDAIIKAGWEVDYVLSAHSKKPESWADFSAAVAAYTPGPCASKRKICRKNWR